MHETSGGLAFQHALGRGAWLPSNNGKGKGFASQHSLGRRRGVGFPACTGKGEWGWLPSMHWEGRGLASQHALGRGGGVASQHELGIELASQHTPELGKAGGMYPTGMLSCL